ncbi:MAG: hypothetical protein VW405_11690 [Rhodospirillaceae bacterium]
MRKRQPSQITQREIDLAAQRADVYGLLAIPQPPRVRPPIRQPRGPMYATLAVVVLALAGMVSLRFAPIRFVGTSCDPRVQVCR